MYRTFALWLIPTPGFRRVAFTARDRSDAFWLRTGDPQGALENLLARDEMFTTVIAEDAKRDVMRTLAVDGAYRRCQRRRGRKAVRSARVADPRPDRR